MKDHNEENENRGENLIGNLLQQPIDDNVNLFSTVNDQGQNFEKMKLADLKNECRRLNLSSTGTKVKLIEKLRNAKIKMSGRKNQTKSFFVRLVIFSLRYNNDSSEYRILHSICSIIK